MHLASIFASSLLAVCASALTQCYYCHEKDNDSSGKGQYPTYKCGEQCGYKYYHTNNDMKCWRSDHDMNLCFIKCCIDEEKESNSVACGVVGGFEC